MRILLVGAGGVGTAFARIAARRQFADLIVSDYDLARAERAAAASDRYQAVRVDARDTDAVAGLLAEHGCDVLMNATDPRFVMPLYRAALLAGVGAKIYASAEESARQAIQPEDHLAPRPAEKKIYDRYYEVYRNLYGATRPLIHQLAGLASEAPAGG